MPAMMPAGPRTRPIRKSTPASGIGAALARFTGRGGSVFALPAGVGGAARVAAAVTSVPQRGQNCALAGTTAEQDGQWVADAVDAMKPSSYVARMRARPRLTI